MALSAYTRVFLLSSLCTSAGLMWAIITVWQLPFRVSFSNLGKAESFNVTQFIRSQQING